MKDRENLIGVEKHIRITDTEINEAIDRLVLLPEYRNFNKVINAALYYGIPTLLEKAFGEVKLDEDKTATDRPINLMYFDERQFGVIVRLLKEIVLNVTINKSILSTLYHVKDFELDGLKVDKHKFDEGLLSDTPDYLNDYEIRGLKSLRK